MVHSQFYNITQSIILNLSITQFRLLHVFLNTLFNHSEVSDYGWTFYTVGLKVCLCACDNLLFQFLTVNDTTV